MFYLIETGGIEKWIFGFGYKHALNRFFKRFLNKRYGELISVRGMFELEERYWLTTQVLEELEFRWRRAT